jgi:hypothetical protein
VLTKSSTFIPCRYLNQYFENFVTQVKEEKALYSIEPILNTVEFSFVSVVYKYSPFAYTVWSFLRAYTRCWLVIRIHTVYMIVICVPPCKFTMREKKVHNTSSVAFKWKLPAKSISNSYYREVEKIHTVIYKLYTSNKWFFLFKSLFFSYLSLSLFLSIFFTLYGNAFFITRDEKFDVTKNYNFIVT